VCQKLPGVLQTRFELLAGLFFRSENCQYVIVFSNMVSPGAKSRVTWMLYSPRSLFFTISTDEGNWLSTVYVTQCKSIQIRKIWLYSL
jgi:hypothetical protein